MKKFNIHDWQAKHLIVENNFEEEKIISSSLEKNLDLGEQLDEMMGKCPSCGQYHSMDFGPNCPQYDGPGKEGVMARGNAMELANDASDIVSMIGPNTNLPEWVESKITLAADYLNKVKDYLTHYEASRQKLSEQSFDDRLKAAGGFSDEEMDDITSRDPEMLSISGLMKKNEERTNAVAEAIANSYGIENDSRLKGIIKVALADYI